MTNVLAVNLKIALLIGALSTAVNAQWMTGFYESRNNVQPIAAIPWSKYTTIVHASAAPDGNGGLLLSRLGQAETDELIASRPPGKDVLVCIQDNGGDPGAFARATSPELIEGFVANIAALVTGSAYDGVDIDWEKNVDDTRYVRLFALLRAALPGKLITADMNNGGAQVSAASASLSFVDRFHIMCYDMDTPGNGFSWYNAALSQGGNPAVMTCDWRVRPFLDAGVPASRIGIGLPFYGRRWQGVTLALVRGNFAPSTVFYNQLVTDASRWQPQYQSYDPVYRSDYLSIPSLNEFDSFTGPREIADAARWIKTQGFGGAMTYSLHYEYLAAGSGDARYPLSSALYEALYAPDHRRSSPRQQPPVPALSPVRDRTRQAGRIGLGLLACVLLVALVRAGFARR
jgi:chitinase